MPRDLIKARGKVRERILAARRAKAGALRETAFKPAWEEPETKHARAEALRRALHLAAQDVEHIEKLDFIPAHFVLQWHGWGDREFLASLGARGRGKSHYDLRVQKLTAPSWFGVTLFSDPTKAPTKGEKHMGTVKGYEQLVWKAADLPPKRGGFAAETTQEKEPAGHALPSARKKGFESMGEMKWMSYSGFVQPGGPGNPTRNLWARMKVIDEGPAVLHRRELDFIDMTLIGRKLRGRFFHRLVKGPTKTEKQTGDSKGGQKIRFYFWRQKGEPANWLSQMQRVAQKKVTLPVTIAGKGT